MFFRKKREKEQNVGDIIVCNDGDGLYLFLEFKEDYNPQSLLDLTEVTLNVVDRTKTGV